GDTIMEVLIAVAVLSLILASTFTLANRSSATTRTAQERGEASKMAISQLEMLKAYMANGDPSDIPERQSFCLTPGIGPNAQVQKSIAYVNNTNGTISSPDNCKNNYYNFYVTRGSGTDYKNVYTAYVVWEAVSGNGYNKVAMPYKVYSPREATN
ncbi:hypothetical protein KDA11_07140, partial [Candidatus Saccharibacteria bacterium]|nr:hypothetical protein [Candidatus Saccharibacteria bacterium]